MNLLYGPKDQLTLSHILNVTKSYMVDHVDRFQEEDFKRVGNIDGLINLTKAKQQRFQDCTGLVDQAMMFQELKIETVTALANLLLLKHPSMMTLTNKQLVNLACYLTERPLDLYPKLAALLGKKELLDCLFRRTSHYFEQRSIFAYLEEQSNLLKIDCQKEKDVLKYQEEMQQFLLENDLPTILSKTNYQRELKQVQDDLSRLL